MASVSASAKKKKRKRVALTIEDKVKVLYMLDESVSYSCRVWNWKEYSEGENSPFQDRQAKTMKLGAIGSGFVPMVQTEGCACYWSIVVYKAAQW